ncbi:MAG: hypothetical protein N2505_00385 [Endomicrobia bacterium]|nr:hypothetical protein [Endomicrobiia bacterium]
MLEQETKLKWIKEYKFCPKRKYRADYAQLDYKIIVEKEGGLWIAGRHNRPLGFLRDIEKYNLASSLGWIVFRCSTTEKSMIEMIEYIKQFINLKNQY